MNQNRQALTLSTTIEPELAPALEQKQRLVKVLVWDLDETLWNGTLLEGDAVRLRPRAREVIETLDRRGILQSIASKNEPDHALAKLQELGVEEYFLYPQISWSSKSSSIRRIAESINIGLDAVALIDDQPFERDEVRHTLPEVMTFSASELDDLPERAEFKPRFITSDSAIRRRMYQADIRRNRIEEEFEGPKEEFLASLGMRFVIGPCQEDDLQRAEELTVRTHQLNTTGYTYSYDELDELRRSEDHLLLVASLDDRYGTYGRIGLALIERGASVWTLKLLLMSCRVMARGVGSILINHLLRLARDAGVRLQAEFLPTDRNRPMLVTYKLGGFKEVGQRDELVIFEHDLQQIQPFPSYVETVIQ